MITQLSCLSVMAINAVAPEHYGFGFSSRDTQTLSEPEQTALSAEAIRHVSELPVRSDSLLPRKVEIGDDVTLRLLDVPDVVLRNFSEIYIKGWDIRISPDRFEMLTVRRAMARQFLRLWRAVRMGTLTECDQEVWGYIVDHIDYAKYCEDTAVPVEFQGVLESRKHGRIEIRWVDGETNSVEGALAERLKYVNEGEAFVCRVRFRDAKVVDLCDIAPITSESSDISWIHPLA